MKQLVELQQHAEEFKKLNAELIFVFREEQAGVDGLKQIRDKRKTTFTLTLDLDKKSSKMYSPEKMTFDNFVLDSSGTVRLIVDGTLTTRAKAEQLLKVLKEIETEKSKPKAE
ncbi:MAG: redoxin domain-containing protein [Planctomycetales bacterium]|nr:redoxin domain-containing protein [Planctomycetales bacterium]